jgi:hypothetical protein
LLTGYGTILAISATRVPVAAVVTTSVRPRDSYDCLSKQNAADHYSGSADAGDVVNAAEYLAGDLAGSISGQHLLLSGGGPA